MDIVETEIPDVKVITLKKFVDERGFFTETYNKKRFQDCGIQPEFVQDNLSFSANTGTIRGLHFQIPPFAQDKLVSVLQGSVLDVAVDIRKGSPTFGHHVVMALSAEEGNQAFVPVGFAHGFCTLEPDTVVTYKVTNYYSPEHDKGIYWADPDFDIDWPNTEDATHVSDKDSSLPRFAELSDYFQYDVAD